MPSATKTKTKRYPVQKKIDANIRSAIYYKIVFAPLIILTSLMFLIMSMLILGYPLSIYYIFTFIALFIGLLISFTCIPEFKDTLKPLVDLLIYIPASISGSILILTSLRIPTDSQKLILTNNVFAYFIYTVIATATIIKCSLTYNEYFEKYILQCKKSTHYNFSALVVTKVKIYFMKRRKSKTETKN